MCEDNELIEKDKSHISDIPNKRQRDKNHPFMSPLRSLGEEKLSFGGLEWRGWVGGGGVVRISCYGLAPPSVSDNVYIPA